MKKLLQSGDIISSRRQAPNLTHILTKARFTMQEEIPSVKKCGDPRCGTCAYIEGDTILLKSGMEIRANSSMNCKSENVIHCAICPTCKEFYIGQTGKLNARVRVHKQHRLKTRVFVILHAVNILLNAARENLPYSHYINFQMKIKYCA